MPWLLLFLCFGTGVGAGVVFGFVRGLHHLPTLVFALFEGAILFGVPAAILGLLLVAVWCAVRLIWRHLL